MLDIANRQQQFLLANRVYATKAQLTASGYACPRKSVPGMVGTTVPSGTVPAFTITFHPHRRPASE